MSGQPAEQSEGFTSSDSRLDAILNQLNALGSSAPAPDTAAPALRSVPDLPSAATDEAPIEDTPPEAESPHQVVSPPEIPKPPAPLASVPTVVSPPPLPDMPSVAFDVPAPRASSLPEIEPLPEPTNFTFGLPEHTASTEIAEPEQVEPEHLAPMDIDAQSDIFDIAPVAEDVPSLTEESPVVVEYHPESDELVFELDGPLETEPVSEEVPTTVLDQLDMPSSDIPSTDIDVATPPPVPPGGDTGWVSHHNETVETTPEVPSSESIAVPDVELSEASMSALVEAQAGVLEVPEDFDAQEAAASFESPEWGEINESDEVVEEAAFSAFNPHAVTKTVDEYQSDEELPLPDFTGVWDDSSTPTVWDVEENDSSQVPEPVEVPGQGSGISVGRNELDSLRPTEEEKLERAPAQNLGRKMQLFAVILFGLIALAVVLLNDPAAVDELRDIYDGFFG